MRKEAARLFPGLVVQRGLMDEQRKHHGREQDRHNHQAEHPVPSDVGGKTRGEKRCQKNPAVSGRGDSHGQPLMLRRIGAACHGKRHGKTRTRRPQQKTDPQHLGIAVTEQPSQRQRHHFYPENAEAYPFRAELIGERPDHDA